MKKNKMANCYGPLNHTKACDYCKIVKIESKDENCVFAFIFFYAGKPFEIIFTDIIKVTKNFIDFWLDFYSKECLKDRKISKSLAKSYWKDAKRGNKILYKFTPEGELIKDYTEGK